ncbi:twin-arginine translocation signal domain-containing protein, partial [Rhizobium leguminosarum]
MTKLTRRNLMTAAAATGLAGALGSRLALAADEPLGITLVIPSPVGDVGWG